jgi:hypothetical protein
MAITPTILLLYINVCRMIILIASMIQKKIVEILHKINFARYQTLKIFAKQVISLIVQKWLLEYISHMMESM